MRFWRKLLGGAEPPSINPDPFKRDTPPPPAAVPVPEPPRPRPSVARDEIIDAQTRICGYRYRVTAHGSTPAEVVQALADAGIRNMAERRLALLPMTAERWRSADYAALIGPGTRFLLASLEAAEPALLAEIKAVNGQVALNVTQVDLALRARMQDFSLLFVDYTAFNLEAFETLVRELKRVAPPLEIMVDGIATWPERRLCDSLGVHYCLGGFIATFDEAEPQEKLSESRMVLIEMLNRLRQDDELQVLAEIAKRDPVVSVQLIAMANSPLMGLAQPVTSVERAILVLGRAQLYRWLTLAMFRVGGKRDKDAALLELALVRAAFLERVAAPIYPPKACDELFLVGLLSVFDVLLGQPLRRVLAMLHLPEDVQAVLLRSEGPYARLLMLAYAVERGRQEQVERLGDALGLTREDVQRSSSAALAWAQAALELGN